MRSEWMPVGHKKITIIFFLHAYIIPHSAKIISEVKFSRWTYATDNNFFLHKGANIRPHPGPLQRSWRGRQKPAHRKDLIGMLYRTQSAFYDWIFVLCTKHSATMKLSLRRSIHRSEKHWARNKSYSFSLLSPLSNFVGEGSGARLYLRRLCPHYHLTY